MPIAPFDPIAQYPELLPIIAAVALIAFGLGWVARSATRREPTHRALEHEIAYLDGQLTDARAYANRLVDDPDFLLMERIHRRLPVGRWRVHQ